MRYFEDVQVGDRASFGRYAVTREETTDFASKYDPQPFHLDDEAAARNPVFGRLSCSGWHTCSMAMRMIVDQMKDDPVAALGAAGIDEIRWLKPVYPGDTLRLETEVVETRALRSRPTAGIVRSRVTAFNQLDEPVMQFISNVLYERRPAAEG